MDKRILFFAVILTALLASFSSCSSGTDDEITSQPGRIETKETQTTESETETETKAILDNLGEHDFDGYAFTMLTPDPDIMNWANPVLNTDETNGIRLNDAIYDRNRAIEARFDMVFKEEYGSWDIGVNNLRTIVEADDTTYDIVTMLDRFALTSLTENLLIPYNEIPYVDLTKPYWGSEMLEYSSIGGKHYFAFGDFSLYAYDNTSALLFNKTLIDNHTLENPYELVINKEWTLDKYSEMCSEVTDDTDGDAVMTENDLYGYLAMPKQVLPTMWIAGGALSVAKDEADHPLLNIEDEKLISMIEKTFSITWDTGTWYQNEIQADTDDTLEKMFINNHGLFLDSTFHKIQRLRDMDADFGIIPYPMADESQNTYLSRVSGSLFSAVPSNSKSLETQGVILEALASESRRTVIPAYYEVSLKGRTVRDEESQEMLDLIFNNRVYDLGDTFWSDDIRDNFIKQMFVNNDRDLASNVASNRKALNKKINRTIEQITTAYAAE